LASGPAPVNAGGYLIGPAGLNCSQPRTSRSARDLRDESLSLAADLEETFEVMEASLDEKEG
jgi:hypothetical protein